LMLHVRFKLLPSTQHRLIQRDKKITRPDGDVPEPGVSEEIAQIDKFRSLMEKMYPILTQLKYTIAVSGACIWMLCYDPDEHTALYESWRQSACAMWQHTSTIVAQTHLQMEDMAVMPLPGPWRYTFL
jgi:hypothetical protein